MSYLQSLAASLSAALSGSGMLPMLLIFVTVFVAVLGVAALLRPRDAIGRRLSAGIASTSGGQGVDGLLRDDRGALWNRLLNAVEKYVDPADAESRSPLRLRLLQAGFRSNKAIPSYYAARVVLAVTLPIGFLLISPFVVRDMEVKMVGAVAGGLALLGAYLPYRLVQSRLESRQLAFTEGFPDALDMLVVCVEAGLGLDAAFTRVGEQISKAHPLMAEEFAIVALELRAGKSRDEALRGFADRTGVQDIQSFTTLIIQSEALGASIAQTLRVQADEMRVTRMLRAEEKAHKLPVKLVVPLVLCILPTMLTVVLLPGIIRIVRTILPALSG